MTSYFVCLGERLPNYDIDCLVDTINPYKTLNTKILNTNQGLLVVSFHDNAPLKGNKYFEDKDWVAVFAGDLIEKSVPWKLILETLEYGNYKMLNNFNGYFSITALNKRENKLFVISDRRSQLPVFYLIDNMNICISTELSTFCRLPIEMSFNVEWLWEYLFFNFPVGQTTFLENVKRMPPASVLEIDIESGEYLFHEYATKFRKKKHLLEGKEALEYAYNVFRNRMPKYFTGANDIACALTGGWDGRTNLSFCPNMNSVVAYTYGVQGCRDLVEASKTAKALNIKHRKILFDKNFEKELPSLVFDAVYLSSGLERITRSSLLYAYRNLTEYGKEFPLVISGISLDILFRGYGANVPEIISPDMGRIFSTGEKGFNENFWKECMGNCYEPFKRHILKQIDNLEKEYGKLSEPESHLSYMVYEVLPKHFAGELAIAKHFTTLRVPAWDTDIIELSYSIRNSTLSFSQFLPHFKGARMEDMILQAYLISKNGGALREIPVYGVPPKTFSKGKSIYHLVRIKNLGPKKVVNTFLGRKKPPLEDWNKWLGGILKDTIGQLIFAENSRIKDYVSPEYINSLQNKVSNGFIGKLAATEFMPTSRLVTAEIILRLFLFSGRHGKR